MKNMNRVERQIMSAAKARLMNHYKITEDQAHVFIINTAMSTRQRKITIATRILTEVDA